MTLGVLGVKNEKHKIKFFFFTRRNFNNLCDRIWKLLYSEYIFIVIYSHGNLPARRFAISIILLLQNLGNGV